MEESTPHSSSWPNSVLVFSSLALLVNGEYHEELVLCSLPPVRRGEGEELVCGTAGVLIGGQNSPTQAVLEWSAGGGRGREGQNKLPFKEEECVCPGACLEVDSEVEPKSQGIAETGQT